MSSEATAEADHEGITPRVLLRIDLEHDYEEPTTTRYEAQTLNQSIRSGNNYEKVIIGFAEFSVNTQIGSRDDFDEFRNIVEAKADYVHWKVNKTPPPRRWGHGDPTPVQCPECGATWAGSTLYKTGSILRCPDCDGAMRP